jgi:CheY-like chemotaxis protein
VAGNLRQTVRECLRKAGGSIVDAPNALAENNEGTFAPQSKKVLIVEDEEILAENLQAHFHRSGWDARIANTGEAAVIAAGEFRPGMILLDYHLPDMNGFEALAAIRAVHCCSCALMTGHPADTVLAEAQRHGIERILAKPFSLAGLEGQLWATAAEFCSKCSANGRRPSREDCGGFAPAQQAHPQVAAARVRCARSPTLQSGG